MNAPSRAVPLLSLALLLVLRPSTAAAVDALEPSRSGGYLSVSGGAFTDFPLSQGPHYLDGFPTLDASASPAGTSALAPVLAAGFAGLGEPGSGLGLRLELDTALGSFSDWRVRDRLLWFLLLSIDFAWSPASLPLTVFLGGSAGMLVQSSHVDYVPAPDPDRAFLYEYLQGVDYLLAFDFGLGYRLGRHFALRVDAKILVRDEGSCGSSSATVIVICVNPPPARWLGQRLSVGVEYWF